MQKLLSLLVCIILGTTMLMAQSKSKNISGRVISGETGEGLGGATVTLTNLTVGTTTDAEGFFAIPYKKAEIKTLTVTYPGMVTQIVEAKSDVEITMYKYDAVVDAPISTAFGRTVWGIYTGSAQVIRHNSFDDTQTGNITQLINGNVAGVRTQITDGQPGAATNISINGEGSFLGNSKPLFIVDGVPYDGNLQALQAYNIERITVLKDAASAALYGSRGANGVVIINTKRGRPGEAKVLFNGKFGINLKRQHNNYDVLTSEMDYINKYQEAFDNANLNSGMLGNVLGYNASAKQDNWEDETYKLNYRQEYNLAVTGANHDGDYRISGTYLRDEGTVRHTELERLNMNVHANYWIRDWLRMGGSLNYTHQANDDLCDATSRADGGNPIYMANFIAPIYPMYARADGQLIKYDGRTAHDYGYGRNWMSGANPMADLAFNGTRNHSQWLHATAYTEANPMEGLTVRAQAGYTYDNVTADITHGWAVDRNNTVIGTTDQAIKTNWGFEAQTLGEYTRTIDFKHLINGVAGVEYYNWEQHWINAFETVDGKEAGFNYYNTDPLKANSYSNTYKNYGAFTRANYSYDDRYYASGIYRLDTSSRIGGNSTLGHFYAGSAAWLLSNEEFCEELVWLYFFKVRGSWGRQGNDGFGSYTGNVMERVEADFYIPSTGEPNWVTIDRDLKWETTTTWNAGIDFAFVNGKLYGSVEYFNRKIDDMFAFNKATLTNVGTMTYTGVNIALNFDFLKAEKYSASAKLNLSTQKNKINKLAESYNGRMNDGLLIYAEGESRYRMELVDYAGVNTVNGEALYWAKNNTGGNTTDVWGTTIPAGWKYKTNDYETARVTNTIETSDLMPKLFGGFGLKLKVLEFDATAQCSFQLGGKVYDAGYQTLMHGGAIENGGLNWHKDVLNSWTPTNPGSSVPRVNANDRYTNANSTRWLTKSDYLALNNVSIGYTFKKELTKKLFLENLRAYVTADNVALSSARHGLDPRQGMSASTVFYAPIRTFSCGVNVTF